MLFKSLSVLALAGHAFAQNTPTLAQALNSSSNLSQLQAVLHLNPGLVETLSGAKNITILAPSNTAFSRIDNATLTGLTQNTGLLTAILQYHVLNGTYPASAVTNTSAFIPTLLTNPLFTNVTGGQRVQAVLRNGNVTFFSGLLANSTVSQANVNFTGGVIHVIDNLLTLPENAADTLSAANLTSLRGALNATSLVSAVNNSPNITVFAPTNAALQAIGGSLANLSTADITNVLTYHVVNGTVGYSSGLSNGTILRAANGANLTITIHQGRIFVNGARVVTSDILIANGVAHVIDAVLNPNNATLANSSATAGGVAFSGASSATNVPFTSGQPTPTRTIAPAATSNAAPGGGASSSSSKAAAAQQTGAMGVGALLGAAAVYFL
ncbi:Fasciclin-domain-containing protein [Setomelanomma holmii]|uniref:Fasciclin-domain-containing protein n=1 Tax=Setomelanomma holmii TaxID=210430 RepID=A0A9P4HGB9_9PLEO|nr:Fasciclin-domain-containing protein [Setomelanomma holmii]